MICGFDLRLVLSRCSRNEDADANAIADARRRGRVAAAVAIVPVACVTRFNAALVWRLFIGASESEFAPAVVGEVRCSIRLRIAAGIDLICVCA